MLFHEYLKNEIFEIVKKLLDKKNLESDFLKNNTFNVEISNRIDFGDLSSRRYGLSGISNGHGGLS